tara:strand:- start:2035 stop:2868 length:834 start_codon:yes stop_codon:yes gene_type:complete
MKITTPATLTILWRSLTETVSGRFTYRAATLSYTTLLSLVPLLTVIISVATLQPGFEQQISVIREYVISNFVPTSREAIELYFTGFLKQTSTLPKFSIAFLFVTTWMLLSTIRNIFNTIWVKHTHKKNISTRIYQILTALIALPIITAGLIVSVYLLSDSAIIINIPNQWKSLLVIFPLVINTFIFFVINLMAPQHYVHWRDALFGGCVTSILFEVSKLGFVFYIKHVANYDLIYGTMAVIPIFLMWIYLLWLITLYGGICTRVHYQIRTSQTASST